MDLTQSNQQTQPTANNANLTPSSSPTSIGGYSSPYISNSTQNATSSPFTSTMSPSSTNSQTTPSFSIPIIDSSSSQNQEQSNLVSSTDSNSSFSQQSLDQKPQLEPIEAEKIDNNVQISQSQTTIESAPIINQETSIPNPNINEPSFNEVPTVDQLEDLKGVSAHYTEAPLYNNDLDPEKDLSTFNPSIKDSDLNSLNQKTLSIKDLLDLVIEKDASDLHLTVGYPAMIRIDGELQTVGEILTPDRVKEFINQTLSGNQKELLEVNKEVDLSYSHESKGRFRVNAYHERGNLAAAYRLIPTKIRSIEELKLPPVLYDFTKIAQGLFLVTGPTGSGKSTTLAGMLQEINTTQTSHIITIEDPIEYVYEKSRALVDQRELGEDTHDWGIALKSILRQDPDIVLIGEMRDYETIQAAITTAETGHLVFATLHTNSAAQSIDRIVDVFPPHQQEQIRTQLAGTLKGILSQRLIPILGGGRQAATELMIVNAAIQNLIREGKTYQIDNIISTSFDIGMTTLERSLVKMVREGKITVETAQEFAIRPQEVLKLMKSGF